MPQIGGPGKRCIDLLTKWQELEARVPTKPGIKMAPKDREELVIVRAGLCQDCWDFLTPEQKLRIYQESVES